MMFITSFFLLAGLFLVYVHLFPLQAQEIITSIKQRWREYLETKYGNQAFEELAQEFRAAAQAKGATPEQIEAILEANKSRIIARRGFEIVEELF